MTDETAFLCLLIGLVFHRGLDLHTAKRKADQALTLAAELGVDPDAFLAATGRKLARLQYRWLRRIQDMYIPFLMIFALALLFLIKVLEEMSKMGDATRLGITALLVSLVVSGYTMLVESFRCRIRE